MLTLLQRKPLHITAVKTEGLNIPDKDLVEKILARTINELSQTGIGVLSVNISLICKNIPIGENNNCVVYMDSKLTSQINHCLTFIKGKS